MLANGFVYFAIFCCNVSTDFKHRRWCPVVFNSPKSLETLSAGKCCDGFSLLNRSQRGDFPGCPKGELNRREGMWLVDRVKGWLVRLGLPNRTLLNFNLSQVLAGLCFRHRYGKVAVGAGPTRFEAEGLPRFPPIQVVLSTYSAGAPEPIF